MRSTLALLLGFASTALSLNVAQSASAFEFGTDGLLFGQDTRLDLTFNESHGKYMSKLALFSVDDGIATWVQDLFAEVKGSDNSSANGWLGTCGNTVLAGENGLCTTSALLSAGQAYTFGLTSSSTTVFSTSALNLKNQQQAVFGSFGSEGTDGTRFDLAFDFQSSNPYTGDGSRVAFEDQAGAGDRDYQDFSFTAKATTIPDEPAADVPEPASVLGLAVTASVMLRRRDRGGDRHAS
ncbi:MAG: PEP-CTERM sorting domain-containing protein [Oscillatoriales cyanobacterium]|jgi:hypothetical protein|nr:MAG: PEP-CTERM sorting domain-containing protein [Oscillatoriales cyanobacterium]